MLRKLGALLLAAAVCWPLAGCKEDKQGKSQSRDLAEISNNSQVNDLGHWIFLGGLSDSKQRPSQEEIENGRFSDFNFAKAIKVSRINGLKMYNQLFCAVNESSAVKYIIKAGDVSSQAKHELKIIKNNKIGSYVSSDYGCDGDGLSSAEVVITHDAYDKIVKKCNTSFSLEQAAASKEEDKGGITVYNVYANGLIWGAEKFIQKVFKGEISSGSAIVREINFQTVDGKKRVARRSCFFSSGKVRESKNYYETLSLSYGLMKHSASGGYTNWFGNVRVSIDRPTFDKLWAKCQKISE